MPNTEQETYEEFQEINLVLSVSEERYEEFQKETKTDAELRAVLPLVKSGWPDTKQQVPVEASCNSRWFAFQGNTPNCPKSLEA